MAKEQSNGEHSTSNISYLTQMSPLEPSYKNPGISQPKAEYVRNKELTYFFGQPMLKGTYHPINSTQHDVPKPCLFYSHPHGEIWTGDVVDWMSTISSESVDLIFADPPYIMSYQLDLVFSHNQAIVSAETTFIHASEIVGSVKTTSKDRIDKIFLDKHLLVKLLGRDIPVIAIFLHDVQRAIKGNTIFGINSTFKTNHFLGYTVALNKLDGVYYVDPRPEMMVNERLRQQIRDFQQFLIKDLWAFSHS
jgi:hypothetical protein